MSSAAKRFLGGGGGGVVNSGANGTLGTGSGRRFESSVSWIGVFIIVISLVVRVRRADSDMEFSL